MSNGRGNAMMKLECSCRGHMQNSDPILSKPVVDGWLLIQACLRQDVASARALIEAGALLNGCFQDDDIVKLGWPRPPLPYGLVKNRTALMCACRVGSAEIVGLLLDAGADANQESANCRNRAIFDAARGDHLEAMDLLLAAGADPHALGEGDFGAIEAAAMSSRPCARTFRRLVGLGVSIEHLTAEREAEAAQELAAWSLSSAGAHDAWDYDPEVKSILLAERERLALEEHLPGVKQVCARKSL